MSTIIVCRDIQAAHSAGMGTSVLHFRPAPQCPVPAWRLALSAQRHASAATPQPAATELRYRNQGIGQPSSSYCRLFSSNMYKYLRGPHDQSGLFCNPPPPRWNTDAAPSKSNGHSYSILNVITMQHPMIPQEEAKGEVLAPRGRAVPCHHGEEDTTPKKEVPDRA